MGARLCKLILLVAALSRLVPSPLAWLERLPQRQQNLSLAGHYWRLVKALPEM